VSKIIVHDLYIVFMCCGPGAQTYK